MAQGHPSPQAAAALAVALLADFSSAPSLTEVLVQLVSTASVAPNVAFYSALHTLVSSLLLPAPSHPPISDLAAFFVDALSPALLAVGIPSDTLADVLVDVVWQVDQQIEAGVVYHQPSDAAAVAVDGEEIAAGRLRIASFLKVLIDAGVVSQHACAECLDTGFITLAPLDIIDKAVNFGRLEIRCRTALFYKQQKFNLLREESEGYAKLAAELLSNMGPPHSVVDARSQEGDKGRLRRASLVNDSVKSLIGNFDLDPDRTLDIILDTFSDQLIQHHQFFLDLLSVSPWAPKKSTTPVAASEAMNGKGKKPLVDLGFENDTGSFLIAQILGFKFEYYQGSNVEGTPEKLYLMTALLIWNGFLKLSDIWSHLSPDDEDLLKMEGRYRDAQAQLARSVGGSNALAMAGVLADDTPIRPSGSSTSTSAPAAQVKRELPNQKLGLLGALLTIGDLTHSLFILAQFPFLVSINPELSDLLSRLLDESINPVYRGLAQPQKTAEYEKELQAPKVKYTSTTKSSSSTSKPTVAPTYLSGRAFPDPTKNFTFFFADWTSRLPRAGDMEEALAVAELYLPFIGVFISRSFPVYSKMCRIIEKDLKTDVTRTARWTDLVRTHLLPAVALLESHSVAAIEIWNVLVHLPIEKRYELYGEWKDTTYRRIPALSVRKAEAERDVKSILRRLSTENVKKLGKTLAKTAHTNPTIIFAIVLNQVQSYDNLIVPVVDAARYLSEFGYDVMTFSLLDALSSGKAKTKEDGTSVAMWLQGLASFAGQLYRRWPPMSSSMWLILQYLVNQLVSGNVKDLVILREIITRMSALEPFADLSDAQVMSLAGGKVLRSEVFNQTDISQASKRQALLSLQSAKNRLINTLQRSGLAMPLLINIAIQRQACVADAEAHLKSLGGLFDGCHAVLFQYMEFLHSALGPETLAAQVPTIADLMEKFGLEAAVAFDIGRPKIRLAMSVHDEQEAKSLDTKRKSGLLLKLAQEKAVAAADPIKVEEKVDDTVKGEDTASPPSVEVSANGDTVMGDATEASPAVVASVVTPWHPGLRDVIETAQRILPPNVLSIMGSAFFVTFWQLTLYDIVYPKERYEAEISRCTAMQKEVNAPGGALKPDEKEKFTRGVIDLAMKLSEEAGKHSGAKGVNNRRLGREKAHWFSSISTVNLRTELVLQIIQYCVHPRAKLSLADAAFSYEFIKRMHSMNTASFHTVVYFDKLLSEQLGPILYTCTENEARNYARFLYDTLHDLHKWFHSADEYKKEAVGPQLQGFLRAGGNPGDHLHHDRLKIMVGKWHSRMAKTFKLGFQSGEYMQIKNTILVLTKIAPYYPIQHVVGSELEASVATLCEVEKRDDLKILASGYKAVLSKRRRHWVDPPVEVKAKPTPPPSVASQTMSRPPTLPLPTSTSSSAAQPSQSASSVPTGPKFGLPVRPGAPGSAPVVSARVEPVVAMEVDKPTPRLSSEPLRRPVESRSTSSSSLPPSTAPSAARIHSSLPQRPGGGRGDSDSSRREEPAPETSSLAPNDKLRQQALASSKRAAPMDPPPAPNAPSSSTSAPLPTRRDSPASTPSAARIPTAPNSRNTSPRPSDNTSSSREKSSRDSDGRDRPSSGRRERERSVDSSDSTRRRAEKDTKYETAKEKNGRGDDRHRGRDERSSRDGRDDSRRSDRDAKDVREAERDDRHKSSSSKDLPSSSSSSRNVRDDDKRSTTDSRRRESDDREHRGRGPSGQSAEREKEKDRVSSSRSDARDKDSRSSRHERSPNRSDAHTSRSTLPTSRLSEQDRPTVNPRSAIAPTGPRADRPISDRLGPASTPAPPTGPSSAPSASSAAESSSSSPGLFSIKGRGGVGRMLADAIAGGGSSSSSIMRDSSRRASGSRSHREEPSKKESSREEEGRKRPSTSSSSLADRLGSGNNDIREEGPSDPKRARMVDTRDPPPHTRTGSSGGGSGSGAGGDRRGGSSSRR